MVAEAWCGVGTLFWTMVLVRATCYTLQLIVEKLNEILWFMAAPFSRINA
jgi:hypothetical protein